MKAPWAKFTLRALDTNWKDSRPRRDYNSWHSGDIQHSTIVLDVVLISVSRSDRGAHRPDEPLERERNGAGSLPSAAVVMGRALRARDPNRLVVRILEVEQEARHEYSGDPADHKKLRGQRTSPDMRVDVSRWRTVTYGSVKDGR